MVAQLRAWHQLKGADTPFCRAAELLESADTAIDAVKRKLSLPSSTNLAGVLFSIEAREADAAFQASRAIAD